MLSLIDSTRIMRKHGFGSLITKPNGNAKLMKSKDWYNAGISLAQASLSGYNMCLASTIMCRNGCLGKTGRAEFTPMIEKARVNRTKLFATNPDLFWTVLEPQLHAIDRKATKLGLPVAFRPNVLSDQSWHTLFPQMFSEFPHWQFYSYTKVKRKVREYTEGKLPANYHVTYSWSERGRLDYIRGILAKGVNVAVPFYDKKTLKPTLPSEWKGFNVIDGDITDLRFLDPKGVIVGLKVKLPKRRTAAVRKINESKGFFVGV